jgi:hypothetical protein
LSKVFECNQRRVRHAEIDSVPPGRCSNRARASKAAKAGEKIARENGRVVLAHGEVTGHAHAIKKPNAALFRDPKLAAIFLQVPAMPPRCLSTKSTPRSLLTPGDYQVIRQREYHPEAIRQVAD